MVTQPKHWGPDPSQDVQPVHEELMGMSRGDREGCSLSAAADRSHGPTSFRVGRAGGGRECEADIHCELPADVRVCYCGNHPALPPTLAVGTRGYTAILI